MNLTAVRRLLPLAVLAGVAVVLGSNLQAGGKDDFKSIFNGKDLTGWKIALADKKADPEKTFYVKDNMIVVSGRPNGYIYTDKPYKNYIVRFDWKYSNDKPGSNSGLLVHIQPPHKVWPKCVEVQGMQGDHGHIFAIMGAKGTFKLDKEAQKKAIKLGEWNTTEVTVRDGTITSKVNGIQVDTGKCDLDDGPFGLQSEGTEMYYKNIKVKALD
jgi:hypothetical protein